jgi:hypothetical protein
MRRDYDYEDIKKIEAERNKRLPQMASVLVRDLRW